MPQVDFQKNAGTNFGVTLADPATYDAAGYDALTYTYADSCSITNFDGFSTTWDTEEDDTYCTTESGSQKTKRRLGTFSLTIKYDKTNTAFHALMIAAEKSQSQVLSIDIAHSNGTDHRYTQAQVQEWNTKFGDAQGSITVEGTFLQQKDVVEVNA